MAEDIAFENGRISNSEGLVTLTMDRVMRHTVMHQSSTSTYMPNVIKIEKNFLWTDGRTHVGSVFVFFPVRTDIWDRLY